MIVDVLDNKELYYGIHKGFKEAFEFIEKVCKENIQVGKYELDGKNLYAMVQEYDTKEAGNWECHRRYIDIQFLVSGNEVIGWDNIKNIPENAEYNTEKDCCIFSKDGGTDVVVNGGTYCILFPHDLHKPGMKYKFAEKVKKVVVKIAV